MKIIIKIFIFSIIYLSINHSSFCENKFSYHDFFTNETLIVGNNPEKISYPGTILKKKIDAKSIRILYYYENILSKPLWINLIIHNKKLADSKIKVLKGLGGPDRDGLFAGHKSSLTFLTNLQQRNFVSFTIPKQESLQIIYHKIKPKMIAAGIIKIDILDKEPKLEIEMQIVEKGFTQFTNFVPLTEDRNPLKYVDVEKALIRSEVKFNAKDLLKEIPIGGPPFVKDKNTDTLLKGNYGVFYNIETMLINNSDQYKKVDLLFSRISGIARGALILNNKLLKTKYFTTSSKQDPELLYTFILKPHSNQKHNLFLSPEAGGFYPINLILRTQETR